MGMSSSDVSFCSVITLPHYRWHPATTSPCMPLVAMSELGKGMQLLPIFGEAPNNSQKPGASPLWLPLWISVSGDGFPYFPETVPDSSIFIVIRASIYQDKLLRTRTSKDLWQGCCWRSKAVLCETPCRDWQCYLGFCMTACWELQTTAPAPGNTVVYVMKGLWNNH